LRLRGREALSVFATTTPFCIRRGGSCKALTKHNIPLHLYHRRMTTGYY
jgi:hypothetical protein